MTKPQRVYCPERLAHRGRSLPITLCAHFAPGPEPMVVEQLHPREWFGIRDRDRAEGEAVGVKNSAALRRARPTARRWSPDAPEVGKNGCCPMTCWSGSHSVAMMLWNTTVRSQRKSSTTANRGSGSQCPEAGLSKNSEPGRCTPVLGPKRKSGRRTNSEFVRRLELLIKIFNFGRNHWSRSKWAIGIFRGCLRWLHCSFCGC